MPTRLLADLFPFWYEIDFMVSLSHEHQANIIEAFNSTSQSLDGLLNIDNKYFEETVDKINPKQLQLNKKKRPLTPKHRFWI